MTTPQEQFTDAARRGQDAMTTALQGWADNMQKLAGTVPVGQAKLPRTDEVVDNMFDFAEQMLATQREFTKSLLAATTPATADATGRGGTNGKKS
ncbi:MAG: hypothetical protein GEV09_09460 [Pseudonocardiaceae bacterium]|nr:hypothetical protein [Pseudonocardiaceae bacterium]